MVNHLKKDSTCIQYHVWFSVVSAVNLLTTWKQSRDNLPHLPIYNCGRSLINCLMQLVFFQGLPEMTPVSQRPETFVAAAKQHLIES